MAINKITLEDITDFKAFPHVNAYQRIALKSAIYPGQGTPLGLIYTALKLNGEAGEFAEHVGKAMRDDGLMNGIYVDNGAVQDAPTSEQALTNARFLALAKELGDGMWYIAAAAKELGLTLEDVMTINLEKLADRSARDALRGSGDER